MKTTIKRDTFTSLTVHELSTDGLVALEVKTPFFTRIEKFKPDQVAVLAASLGRAAQSAERQADYLKTTGAAA